MSTLEERLKAIEDLIPVLKAEAWDVHNKIVDARERIKVLENLESVTIEAYRLTHGAADNDMNRIDQVLGVNPEKPKS